MPAATCQGMGGREAGGRKSRHPRRAWLAQGKTRRSGEPCRGGAHNSAAAGRDAVDRLWQRSKRCSKTWHRTVSQISADHAGSTYTRSHPASNSSATVYATCVDSRTRFMISLVITVASARGELDGCKTCRFLAATAVEGRGTEGPSRKRFAADFPPQEARPRRVGLVLSGARLAGGGRGSKTRLSLASRRLKPGAQRCARFCRGLGLETSRRLVCWIEL